MAQPGHTGDVTAVHQPGVNLLSEMLCTFNTDWKKCCIFQEEKNEKTRPEAYQ